jgi:hypothetical protein
MKDIRAAYHSLARRSIKWGQSLNHQSCGSKSLKHYFYPRKNMAAIGEDLPKLQAYFSAYKIYLRDSTWGYTEICEEIYNH